MSELIKGVCETQFGTAYEVYKDAVKIDSSIRLKDVTYYLNKPESVQTHFKHKTHIIALLVQVTTTNSKYTLWMCVREIILMVLDMDYVLLIISQKWLVSYLLKTDHPQK